MKHHLIITALSLAFLAPDVAHAEPVSSKPNVILILADDLGYGELGCYGGPVKTPHMDRLAAEGVRCTDGYAAFPVCCWQMGCRQQSVKRHGLHPASARFRCVLLEPERKFEDAVVGAGGEVHSFHRIAEPSTFCAL